MKYVALIVVSAMVYFTGYSQGMNHGWDVALRFDPQCKDVK